MISTYIYNALRNYRSGDSMLLLFGHSTFSFRHTENELALARPDDKRAQEIFFPDFEWQMPLYGQSHL